MWWLGYKRTLLRTYGVETDDEMDIVLIENVKFDADGLIPAIVQAIDSSEVLMMAYMNAESLALTLSTGETHFWSRSRQELWHKGAISGNIQRVVDVRVDCDADTLLIRVNPAGPACHTGNQTCFYREIAK
jgi:phosphoribosyl-AMP cyclohydrolase